MHAVLFARILTFISLAACAACTPASAPESKQAAQADWEKVYLERLERQRSSNLRGGGIGRYDPTVPVKGAKTIQVIPRATQAVFSDATMQQASTYAREHNSSALIVWQDGAIVFERYFGDFNAKTPLVSKSLAKPLTALLVGRAIEQGYIKSLDQRASDFITEWRGVDGKEDITLHQLLSMRSGLLAQGFSNDPQSVLNRAYLHPRHDEEIINNYPLTDPPGSVYEYSNANAELIAPIIQRATGMAYADYVTTALLEPLGAAGGEVWINRPGGTAHSGCCIMLPAHTWLKMAILVQNDGVWNGKALLPEGYAERMRTPTEQNIYHGMGVWAAGPYIERRGSSNPRVKVGRTLHGEPYADKDLTLFDGNSNQVVYMIPSQNMIVLRTGNYSPRDLPWDNSYLPNLFIRDFAKQTGMPLPQPQPVR